MLTGAFLRIVRDARPDVVVIAGDIYDRAVPPTDSIELLSYVLHQIVRGLNIRVVMIAGNHDDQRRLAFAADLLSKARLYITDSPSGFAWHFDDQYGPVHILAANYGSPALIATTMGDETISDHEAAFAAVMRNLRGTYPLGERSVVVAHGFVQGGLTSDSERLLQVGGSGAVSAAHLAEFDYVAMGHLHRPHSLDGGRIRYAGSPLAYSFAEDHKKSVTLVDLDAAGVARIEDIELKPRVRLRRLRGTLTEMLEAVALVPDDWLQVTLTDRPFDAIARLRERHPMVLDLRFEAASATNLEPVPDRAAARDPLDVLGAFWRTVRGEELPEAARPDLLAAITAAAAGEG